MYKMKKSVRFFLFHAAAVAFIFCWIPSEASSISGKIISEGAAEVSGDSAVEPGNMVPEESAAVPENTIPEESTSVPENTVPEDSVAVPENTVPEETTAVPENTVPGESTSVPENTVPGDSTAVSENNISEEISAVSGNTILKDALSVSYNSISAEAADWIEIADFKELRRIINSSIRPQTRHVRLTSDITITGTDADTYYIISPPAAPIYIDTGEYTIYVEGQLVVMGSVSVFGKGGDGGLIHINKGGYATFEGGSLRADQGYALWQEDGAFFTASDLDDKSYAFVPYSCEGECRYPDKPVVWDSYEKDREETAYRIIPTEIAFDPEVLPAEFYSTWCDKGKKYKGKLPVFWEVDENTQASLKERKRTLINGNYGPDYDMGRRPECMALFQNKNAAVIINGMLTVYSPSQSVMEIRFALENPKEEDGSFYVEFSRDGKQWQRSEQGKYRLKNGITFFYENYEDRNPAVYYCVCVQKDGRNYYSDIVMISEDNTLVIGDIHGGRGGGTPILSGMQETDKVSGNKEGEGNTVGISPETETPYSDEEGETEQTEAAAEKSKTEEEKTDPYRKEVFSYGEGKEDSGNASFAADEEKREETQEYNASGQSQENFSPTQESSEETAESIAAITEEDTGAAEERRKQIFMGFGSVGIILAAVFCGNALVRKFK